MGLGGLGWDKYFAILDQGKPAVSCGKRVLPNSSGGNAMGRWRGKARWDTRDG